MAIVSNIFSIVDMKIKEHGVSRVIQVKLVVGDMAGVEDMTMTSCFEIFAKNTPAEGARLVIEHVPIKAQCQKCGNEFTIIRWNFKCPDCGNMGIRIMSGKELYIESIEAE
jgi:hydrogenase nickel incorporation protein HypA/HybF